MAFAKDPPGAAAFDGRFGIRPPRRERTDDDAAADAEGGIGADVSLNDGGGGKPRRLCIIIIWAAVCDVVVEDHGGEAPNAAAAAEGEPAKDCVAASKKDRNLL